MADEAKQTKKKDHKSSDKGPVEKGGKNKGPVEKGEKSKGSVEKGGTDTKNVRTDEKTAKREDAVTPKPKTDQETQKEKPAEVNQSRKKNIKHVSSGIAHINATFNNTLVTITDMKGSVIAWSNGGRMGFKGTRKSTAYAATMVAQDVVRRASAYRLQEVEVRVQGPGAGRESAIRALQAAGLMISVILDVTPMPHNGCRPRKRRRV